MEVILKERVENLGILGDVVTVKPGYARNYLVPYGKAVRATKSNIETFKKQRAELEKAEAQRFERAKHSAEAIEAKTFTVEANAGDGGKLFGSVGTKEIAEAISQQASVDIAKSYVRMPEGPIRTVGTFEVVIHLYSNINATATVEVVAQEVS